MAGKKYTARGKTVQKMSKDGLIEENLHDHTKKLAIILSRSYQESVPLSFSWKEKKTA